MAFIPEPWYEYDEESESGFRQSKTRVFGVPDESTLSTTGIDMQEGDTLPGDATYEIISSRVETLVRQAGPDKGQEGRAVRVRAVKFKTEADAESGYYWEELSGSRTFDDTDPQVVRYTITFVGLTASAVPAVGSAYISFPGAGTLTSTNLDREPVAVRISQKKKATVLKSFVTVVFQAHHARTTTGSPGTEINPRKRVRIGRRAWKGTRRFSVPVASAAALESSLYGTTFPGLSGKYAPKCTRVEILDNWEPSRSLVVADYETPRVVGEGKLRIEIGGEKEVVTIDKNKKVIVGPEKRTGKSADYWERRIIRGSNVRFRPMATIILETAATSFNINTVMRRVGCVNKYDFPNFGGAQKGTLLFLGAPQTTFYLYGDLWYLNFAFKYSGPPSPEFPKWNDMLQSQPGSYVPRKSFGVDVDGDAVTGATKWIMEWTPNVINRETGKVGIVQPKTTHPIYSEADFRDLGKDLIITGIA